MPRSQVRILRYQNWSIDIQTCEQIDYSSNLSDRSYCLWANRNFPLLVRREIRTHQLQSTSFPPPPSLSSFISPRSSLSALCVNFEQYRGWRSWRIFFLRSFFALVFLPTFLRPIFCPHFCA